MISIKKKNYNQLIILIGIALIVTVSIIKGFENAAIESIYHVIKDFTTELLVHAYIAGIILTVIGIIRYFKEK